MEKPMDAQHDCDQEHNMIVGYLATVTDQFQTTHYRKQAERVKAFWPNVTEWIEPADMGWSLTEWLSNWENILPKLNLLVVIPRPDMTVGRGCWQEIDDCRARKIPIYIATNTGFVRKFKTARLPGNNYRRWTRIEINSKQEINDGDT